MNPPQETPWDRIVAARHRSSGTATEEEVAPPGFSTRIVAHWAELRQNEQVRLWSRWSWRAALGGALAALLVTFFSPAPTQAVPLPAPVIELPSFPAP